jgi:predicted DNA-binding mobile mystery protein A
MSETAVRSAENNEAKGRVQLNTLSKLADALDCEVLYALVPRSTLQCTVEQQAERIASELVGRVATSMKLEEQGTSRVEELHSVESMKAEILRKLPANFWNV